MPQVVRLLFVALALALVAAPAAATESTKSGGAEATATAKRVSVKHVQRALGIHADGIAGPQTRRALRRFQRTNGLTVTGRADAATLAALGLTDQSRKLDSASGDAPAVLARIAQCESGGNPKAVSPDGRYRGKYQFSRDTWRGLGGTGDPAEADEATQDALALKLYRERGSAPWPSCG